MTVLPKQAPPLRSSSVLAEAQGAGVPQNEWAGSPGRASEDRPLEASGKNLPHGQQDTKAVASWGTDRKPLGLGAAEGLANHDSLRRPLQ